MYWYDVGGHLTSNSYLAKMYQVLALLENRADGTAIILSAPCIGDCSAQFDNLGEFARAMHAAIQQSI